MSIDMEQDGGELKFKDGPVSTMIEIISIHFTWCMLYFLIFF